MFKFFGDTLSSILEILTNTTKPKKTKHFFLKDHDCPNKTFQLTNHKRLIFFNYERLKKQRNLETKKKWEH